MLRAGDLVQVRGEEEILNSLGGTGRLEDLPFMPEMLRHCGETLRVFKRADKTCVPLWFQGLRRMEHAVFLQGSRCDGSAHGNCQAGCLFFWKEEWLRPVTRGDEPETRAIWRAPDNAGPITPRCTPEDLTRATRVASGSGVEVFSCQATELHTATTLIPAWDVGQYVRDVRSGNVGISHAAPVLVRGFARKVFRRRRFAKTHSPVAGRQAPLVQGRGAVALASALNLQPGDRVQVRSRRDIEATLDSKGRNRGLMFRPEMLLYCGSEFRILKRVERMISERTGQMMNLRDCIVLDGINCDGDFHRFCPRSVHLYWREAWLRKLD